LGPDEWVSACSHVRACVHACVRACVRMSVRKRWAEIGREGSEGYLVEVMRMGIGMEG
jgi:hypothetical protein